MRLGRDRDPEELEHARKFKNTRRARYKGFDLCASPPVPPRDRKRLERMLRYMLRPPIAQGRLRETADGRIALDLKQPWDDGTSAIVFEPLELLEKIAAIIPRPQSNQIIYHGVLGPAAKWRKQVVKYGRPEIPDMTGGEADAEPEPEPDPENGYIPWSELMQRTFGLDVMECEKCGGRMKFLALIEDHDTIFKILDHLGLPTEPPRPRPARPPPEDLQLDFDDFVDPEIYAE